MNRTQRVDRFLHVIRARGCVWMSVIMIGLLCGCGASHMTIHLQGDKKRLNTCGQRDPQPVVVRLYQLRGEANFRKATNDSFWKNDVTALGDELIGPPSVLMLRPGEEKPFDFVLDQRTVFVAVAADFCKPDGDSWRQVFKVRDKAGEISIILYEGRIVLQGK